MSLSTSYDFHFYNTSGQSKTTIKRQLITSPLLFINSFLALLSLISRLTSWPKICRIVLRVQNKKPPPPPPPPRALHVQQSQRESTTPFEIEPPEVVVRVLLPTAPHVKELARCLPKLIFKRNNKYILAFPGMPSSTPQHGDL